MPHHTKTISDGRLVTKYLSEPEKAYATVLVMVCLHQYGPVAVWGTDDDDLWSPQTRRLELEQDFGVFPEDTQNILEAGVAICTTNFFYKDLSRFIILCNTICGDGPESLFDPPDSAEILWAMTEAALLWPPDEDPEDTEFSDDIRRFIGEALYDEGITKPFDLLRMGYRPNANSQIDTAGTDDPDMFSALSGGDDARNDELRGIVMTNLQEMHEQLNSLLGRERSEEMKVLNKRMDQMYAAMSGRK